MSAPEDAPVCAVCGRPVRTEIVHVREGKPCHPLCFPLGDHPEAQNDPEDAAETATDSAQDPPDEPEGGAGTERRNRRGETPTDAAARREREAAEWRERIEALRTADPAEGPMDFYEPFLRAIRMHEPGGSVHESNITLNSQCWALSAEATSMQFFALAKLVQEGILEPDADLCGQYTIHRERFPDEGRDYFAEALEWLAHKCVTESVDDHSLKYQLNIYDGADREAVLARLQSEGFINAKQKILKRPEGATAECHVFNPSKFGEAEIRICRHEGGGFAVRVGCSVDFGKSNGSGQWCPVRAPGTTFEDEHGWSTRDAALEAGCIEVARIEEGCEQAALSKGAEKAADAARKIRAWAEMLLKRPIPRQHSVESRPERGGETEKNRRETEATSEATPGKRKPAEPEKNSTVSEQLTLF
jgi:hypothetical protein